MYDRIKAVERGPGRAPIDPKILMALWLYATVEGVGSARHLDELCRDHAAFQWIVGDVSINYHTLADFRTDHVDMLDDLLTKGVATLMAEGLVDLNRVAQDGMRVRASAGAASFRRRPTLEEALAQAEAQVEALRQEVEDDPAATDRRRKAARQRAARERAERIQAALERLPELEAKKKPDQKEQARCSTTDADATVMKMADGGFRPAYNFQFATDTATQFIAGVAVETTGSDAGQMVPMVEQVEERSGKVPPEWLVDGGFAQHDQIEAVSDPEVGLHGVRPGAQAQGPEGGPARAEAGRQCGGGGVAGADGDGAGQGDLQGACRDGRMCQRVGPRPGSGARVGAWRGQGEGDRAVVCAGAQPAVCGAAAPWRWDRCKKRRDPGADEVPEDGTAAFPGVTLAGRRRRRPKSRDVSVIRALHRLTRSLPEGSTKERFLHRLSVSMEGAMPLAEQPTQPLRGHKTICLPCSREQYEQCVNDPQLFREFLDKQIEAHPELFPPEI